MSFYKYFPGFLEAENLRERILQKEVITLEAVEKVEKVEGVKEVNWERDQGAPKD